MRLAFRTTLERYLPPWLCARILEGKVRGFKFLAAAALLADGGIDSALQGLQARFPGLGTPTALPYLGRDRKIRRGIDETDASYAARLVRWLDDWPRAGSAYAIMQQVRAFCAPARPRLRIVNASGTWYTLHPDDTFEIVQTWGAINWDWDGDAAALPTRCWLIIYSDQGPWTEGGAWDDVGAQWDDGRTWGTSATAGHVASVRAIVDEFKCAGDRFENIIIAFDPASFDPLAAPGSPGMPDGTWGHWSTNVGGVQVPARLETAEYWDGV